MRYGVRPKSSPSNQANRPSFSNRCRSRIEVVVVRSVVALENSSNFRRSPRRTRFELFRTRNTRRRLVRFEPIALFFRNVDRERSRDFRPRSEREPPNVEIESSNRETRRFLRTLELSKFDDFPNVRFRSRESNLRTRIAQRISSIVEFRTNDFVRNSNPFSFSSTFERNFLESSVENESSNSIVDVEFVREFESTLRSPRSRSSLAISSESIVVAVENSNVPISNDSITARSDRSNRLNSVSAIVANALPRS